MSAVQKEEVTRLRAHIRKLAVRTFPENRDGFDAELDELRRVDQRVRSNLDEFHTATLGSSMAKNRFVSVKPNEGTIVRLQPTSMKRDGTYINANYIDARQAMGVPFVYIATQAPLPNTVLDFWRMVYENDVAFIVMLCSTKENGMVKSEMYWPDKGEVLDLGLLTVVNVSENVRRDSVHRTLRLRTIRGDERKVFHMQYKTWPDNGVPETSAPLMEMIQALGRSEHSVRVPIVVHCSGGVGRTGVFIGLHIALAQLQLERQDINLQRIVRFLKLCRSGMVQRKDQYLFLYYAALREMQRMVLSAECGVSLLDNPLHEQELLPQSTSAMPPPMAMPSFHVKPIAKLRAHSSSRPANPASSLATLLRHRVTSPVTPAASPSLEASRDVAQDMAMMENYLQRLPSASSSRIGDVSTVLRMSNESFSQAATPSRPSSGFAASGRESPHARITQRADSPVLAVEPAGPSGDALEDELLRAQNANRLMRFAPAGRHSSKRADWVSLPHSARNLGSPSLPRASSSAALTSPSISPNVHSERSFRSPLSLPLSSAALAHALPYDVTSASERNWNGSARRNVWMA